LVSDLSPRPEENKKTTTRNDVLRLIHGANTDWSATSRRKEQLHSKMTFGCESHNSFIQNLRNINRNNHEIRRHPHPPLLFGYRVQRIQAQG
jgi:hypothetical protein